MEGTATVTELNEKTTRIAKNASDESLSENNTTVMLKSYWKKNITRERLKSFAYYVEGALIDKWISSFPETKVVLITTQLSYNCDNFHIEYSFLRSIMKILTHFTTF